ncbi:tripartite tricarboxylate transporter permease [Breznakiella homolactica]|uniref:Tripartite tricarboxylate transporter permease n=1 Tax=Breznakiella homolactica TaxID=2798577 RepID=A0A7T7XLT4_9SPIR|nr:tripartite tricarboxylate transporter permease [Breznakiella homolactica]QQO08665.1 tripartite tricarboxylate transporter permease [Breznakiella homolactica]
MEIFAVVMQNLFSPVCLVFMLLGCIMGIIFGALPGLSGTVGVTLLLPMTYRMNSELGIALLISIWVGGVSGGFISATLLGIPGTASSIATCFDAYPLSKQGKAKKALTIGVVASFIGTFLSCIIAMVLCQYVAKIAMRLGPWEYFSLCLCAIILVVSLSKGDVIRGLTGAAIGLLLACVGAAPVNAVARFTFGSYNLYGGIDSTSVMLGIFAIYLVAKNFASGETSLPQVSGKSTGGEGLTLKEFISNIGNMIRSFLIGLWIGFLPGMGAGLSNMVAYGQAKSASKTPEKFGNGAIEGVFATETANNASVGGALIPMVALGIPGDATTAVLLGALTIHGLEPGPLLFQNNPVYVYVLFGAAILAALYVFALQIGGIRLFPKILQIPYHYLYPAIIVLCFIGAYSSSNTIFTIGMMLAMGALSVAMAWANIPATPFMMAFILGEMLEKYLRRGISYSANGGMMFFTRPVSLILLVVALLTLVWPMIRDARKKKAAAEGKE